MLRATALGLGLCFLCSPAWSGDIAVDKKNRLIKIDAKIAPRKLPHLKSVYPIEVIACWPHPRGKKAHETVVTIEASPSTVHQALESLGLKEGKPVMGPGEPKGPAVEVYLEIDGKRLTMDKILVDSRTNKPFAANVQWRFTGSVQSQPDPEKDATVYGADLVGTLICVFPVTNQTVLQTNLTMEQEKGARLEVNSGALPKEGTPVKLVIAVPKAK